MRLYFRPFPGLTVFTLIGVSILIALGTWQYQRWHWKTALLSEIENAVTAPAFTQISDVQSALNTGVPIDFRRIEVPLSSDVNAPVFFVYSPQKSALFWRPYMPVDIDGVRVFAAFDPVTDAGRDAFRPPELNTVSFAGYVRLARGKIRGQAKSTPSANRWFGFNPLQGSPLDWAVLSGADLGEASRADIDTRYYIDLVSGVSRAGDLPIKRPAIRNNHFDYMLTWYGLALTLCVIYLILHRRHGRLRFRRPV